MTCEIVTLSLLLKKGDTTTFTVLVGVGVGSFLLGTLATIALRILRRPTLRPSLEQDPYSHSTVQRNSNGVYDGVPYSPRSLSQTFVRHSLKPPTNMFNSKEKHERNSLQPISLQDRQNGDNPFGSIGKESLSSLASEVIPRFERVELVCGHHVNLYNPCHSDTRNQRDVDARQRFPRSTTESNIHKTGSMPDLSITTTHSTGERAEALGYLSQDPARVGQSRIQRARSDPRIVHSGREKTKYKYSAHELRRMRTFSSPEHDSDTCDDRGAAVMEIPERKQSRVPRLAITHLPKTAIAASDLPRTDLTTEQVSDLTRQNSQRAAVFYQEHANRHLSLSHGGPLSSTGLPDSPNGVIGDSSLA